MPIGGGIQFELPGIDVALLWHRRHETDPAQIWLRETITSAAHQVAAATAAPATAR